MWCLKIVNVSVPEWVVAGDSAKLECHVDLEGDTLYSLTWWRDKAQFYQFSPTSPRVKTLHHLDGITVDESSSSQSEVVLENVTLETGGSFRCEVVADFPTFEKDSMVKDMAIIDVPDRTPVVTVKDNVYSEGQTLTANCTSLLARPTPALHWLINGHEVPSEYSKIVSEGSDNPLGLLSPTSQLRLPLTHGHFLNGKIQLTCRASIPPIYSEYSDVLLYSPQRKQVAPSQMLYGTGTVVGANLVMVGVTCVVTVFLLVM